MPSVYPAALDAIPLPDFDSPAPVGALGQPARPAGAFLTDVVDAVKAIQQTIGTSTAPGELLDTMLPRLDSTPIASALTIGTAAVSTNAVTIKQDTDTTAAVTTAVQVIREANDDQAVNLGKAMRVKTYVNVVSSAQNEWAVSGEIDNYNAGAGNAVAVSGVANKYASAHGTFGGHFQAKDHVTYAAPTDVTGLVGAEINNPAIGLDHPTANASTGNRRTLTLIARTNPDVVGAATAEIGVGLYIHTDGQDDSGYYRYGIRIDEAAGNPDPITTGISVETTGAYGIRLSGANTVAAIGLESGQRVAFEGTGAITVGHEATPNRINMYSSGGVARIQFEVSTTPSITIGTARVLNTRKQGWSVATGTATRTAFATTTVTTEQLAERVKALIDDLHNTAGHGLIGT